MLRIILTFLALCGLAILVAGYSGAVWPPGDAFAVFRAQILLLAVPVLLGLLLTKARRSVGLMGVVVGLMAVQTTMLWRGSAPRSSDADFVLYQKNLLWNGTDPDAILADILSVDADFVTLEETSDKNSLVTDGLAAAYPHRLVCNTTGNGGIALFSKFPIRQPSEGCSFASGLVLVQAMLPDGRSMWLGAVHLNWPWPYRQARQVNRIVPALSALEGPMLIAGDFNMVPWGSSVQGVAKAAQSRRLGGYGTTFPGFGRFAPLAIDHVLIPGTGRGSIETRPLLGSDHIGLVARFSF